MRQVDIWPQWRHQRGGGMRGIPPLRRLSPPPPSEGKNCKNQPFLTIFFDFCLARYAFCHPTKKLWWPHCLILITHLLGSHVSNWKVCKRVKFYILRIFGLDMWHLTSRTYEGSHSHVISINQLWFQVNFNFSSYTKFTSYNLTSDDIWPWYGYVTFDLKNIWRFPSYIYEQPQYVTTDLINKWGFSMLGQKK